MEHLFTIIDLSWSPGAFYYSKELHKKDKLKAIEKKAYCEELLCIERDISWLLFPFICIHFLRYKETYELCGCSRISGERDGTSAGDDALMISRIISTFILVRKKVPKSTKPLIYANIYIRVSCIANIRKAKSRVGSAHKTSFSGASSDVCWCLSDRIPSRINWTATARRRQVSKRFVYLLLSLFLWQLTNPG